MYDLVDINNLKEEEELKKEIKYVFNKYKNKLETFGKIVFQLVYFDYNKHNMELIEKIKEKEKVIEDKNKTIQAKDQTIKDKDKTIQAKDQTIKHKDKTIQAKDQTIKDKDKTIEDKNNTIKQKDKELEKEKYFKIKMGEIFKNKNLNKEQRMAQLEKLYSENQQELI